MWFMYNEVTFLGRRILAELFINEHSALCRRYSDLKRCDENHTKQKRHLELTKWRFNLIIC